jgi:hypothetical protein
LFIAPIAAISFRRWWRVGYSWCRECLALGKAVVCLAHISAEKLFACVLYGDAIMGRERPNLRREFML